MRCDEQKPACLKCLKSGRQCAGYDVHQGSSDSNSIKIVHWQPNTLALHRLSVALAGSREELRAFDFFRKESATRLGGLFESDFWNRLVLQASHKEPTIRHGVIALGSLLESVEQLHPDSAGEGSSRNKFALQQCNRAIGELKQDLCANGQRSIEMVLISCIIFICFESIQGSYEAALTHLQSGLLIFRDWQVANKDSSPYGTPASSRYHKGIDSEITQILARLNLQAITFIDTHLFHGGLIMSDAVIVVDSVPGSFHSINEARDWLDGCMSSMFQSTLAAYFSQQLDITTSQPQPLASHKSLDVLLQWSDAFDAFVKRSEMPLSSKELQGATLLEIRYRIARILIMTGLGPRETDFDAFYPDFDKIVSLASALINDSGLLDFSEARNHYSFEQGIVSPLYLVASRCREPSIRRRALSLLSAVPRQECLWNSQMLSRIAKKIILLEEEEEDSDDLTVSTGRQATIRLAVLQATIDSEKRQVLMEFCQTKPGTNEEICLRDEWVAY